MGEALIREITSVPKSPFTIEGKIRIFENIEDELAFVRVSLN
jgi:hypothetical protein